MDDAGDAKTAGEKAVHKNRLKSRQILGKKFKKKIHFDIFNEIFKFGVGHFYSTASIASISSIYLDG